MRDVKYYFHMRRTSVDVKETSRIMSHPESMPHPGACLVTHMC